MKIRDMLSEFEPIYLDAIRVHIRVMNLMKIVLCVMSLRRAQAIDDDRKLQALMAVRQLREELMQPHGYAGQIMLEVSGMSVEEMLTLLEDAEKVIEHGVDDVAEYKRVKKTLIKILQSICKRTEKLRRALA